MYKLNDFLRSSGDFSENVDDALGNFTILCSKISELCSRAETENDSYSNYST